MISRKEIFQILKKYVYDRKIHGKFPMDELYLRSYIPSPELSAGGSIVGSADGVDSTTGSGSGGISTGDGSVDTELRGATSPQTEVSDGVDSRGATGVGISIVGIT